MSEITRCENCGVPTVSPTPWHCGSGQFLDLCGPCYSATAVSAQPPSDPAPKWDTATPRTDEEESSYDYRIIPDERHYSLDADFARTLERELDQAEHTIAGLVEQLANDTSEQAKAMIVVIQERDAALAKLAEVEKERDEYRGLYGEALPWKMFYKDNMTLGEMAERLGGTIYDLTPAIYAPLMNFTKVEGAFKATCAQLAAAQTRIAELEELIPPTYYAGLPTKTRMERLINQWRKLVAAENDRINP